VAAAVLLNPGALVYDGGLSLAVRETRTLAQKALRLSTWRRVVEGKTTVSAHFRTARVLAAGGRRKAAELPSRLKRRRAGSSDDELDRDLDRLDREDRPLTMVFAGEEPLYARLVRDGLPDRLERWPRISLTHIELPADVHTLRPLWVQQRVHALLDAAVGEQAARWRPDPVPAA
jgi:hypothetical protein